MLQPVFNLFRRILPWVAITLTVSFALESFGQEEAIAEHERGRDIYNFRCYFCHGYSGDARTLASSYLTPKPRDFTKTPLAAMSSSRMVDAITNGRPGTAMVGFSRLLDESDVLALVNFIRVEFMLNKRTNTAYHTIENGWEDHDRYLIAFPFATGEIPLDTPGEELSAEENRGKQLFLTACITCHDRARVLDEGIPWSSQSLSYPRNNYSHKEASEGVYPSLDTGLTQSMIDGITAASVHALHDIAPTLDNMTVDIVRGKRLYEANCAFCHAADGTGKNWIGSFLLPRPRDFTNNMFMQSTNRSILKSRILGGIPGTSMPAWRAVLNDEDVDHIISYISAGFHPVAEI